MATEGRPRAVARVRAVLILLHDAVARPEWVCLQQALPQSVARLGTWGTGPSIHPVAPPDRVPPPSELLELRAQGQRDVQWLQRGALLRLLLPAPGLGEAPPRVRPEPAGPRGRRR